VSSYVLDASALLALWFNETGAGRVEAAMPHSSVSAVNYSEALAKFVAKGGLLSFALTNAELSELAIVAFDEELAVSAAGIKALHPRADLSFADRACLALAAREGATALTSDKLWSSLRGLGVVEQFR
jgi:ribonuclease VapC